MVWLGLGFRIERGGIICKTDWLSSMKTQEMFMFKCVAGRINARRSLGNFGKSERKECISMYM